jgi:hypothetical protein
MVESNGLRTRAGAFDSADTLMDCQPTEYLSRLLRELALPSVSHFAPCAGAERTG